MCIVKLTFFPQCWHVAYLGLSSQTSKWFQTTEDFALEVGGRDDNCCLPCAEALVLATAPMSLVVEPDPEAFEPLVGKESDSGTRLSATTSSASSSEEDEDEAILGTFKIITWFDSVIWL